MAHDVFVSYSTKDKSVADSVVAALEQQQMRCWYAPRDVPAGANFADSIIGAIDDCKVFVLIWSAHTNTSEHILNEINRAFDQGIVIIPFRIQDIQPTRAMSYYFGRTHWLDALTPPLEKHIAILGSTILKVLGREPISEPSTAKAFQAEQAPVLIPEPTIEAGARPAKTESKPLIPKKTKETEAISDTQHLPVSFKKFMPYAAGVLVVLALAGMLLSGMFKRSPPSEANQVPPQATPSTQPADTPVPVSTSQPDWAEQFSSTILAAIKDRPPDYVDDFSQQNMDWEIKLYDPGNGTFGCTHTNTDNLVNGIFEGVLQATTQQDCGMVMISNSKIDFRNFVLKTDVRLDESDIRFWLVRTLDKDSGRWTYEYDFDRHQWYLITSRDDGVYKTQSSGYTLFNASEPVRLMLIFKEHTSIFYLNDIPLAYFFDEMWDSQGNPGVEFQFEFQGNVDVQSGQLDNLRVWDLDRIENIPIIAEMDGEKILLTPITNPENQHRYLYVENPLNWHQARDYCAQLGGHLVTIGTPEENNFVYELSSSISWLGASDEDQEGVWVWVDGSPFEFKNWSDIQPDNFCTEGVCEDYLTFFDMGFPEWNDRTNEDVPFVCEWEPAETR